MVAKMDDSELGKSIKNYCYKYKVPSEHIIDILEDQKVVPMIRGKATEYDVELLLKQLLNPREWEVRKLNLNAQNGTHDEDVTVTHVRTGVIIKVECKNATRGSFKFTPRAKIKDPFCTIKCHKSRSDLKKADTTNDRYLLGDFHVVISNLSNAVIAGATYSEYFELVEDERAVETLARYYKCAPVFQEIFDAAYNDWRFAMAEDIAENGVIPRTPKVLLENDPIWKPVSEIEDALLEFVKLHRKDSKR